MSGDPRKYIVISILLAAVLVLSGCTNAGSLRYSVYGWITEKDTGIPSRGRRWGWGRLQRAQTLKADARAAMSLLMFTWDRVLAGLKEVETCLEC